jgi:hypothetical protein
MPAMHPSSSVVVQLREIPPHKYEAVQRTVQRLDACLSRLMRSNAPPVIMQSGDRCTMAKKVELQRRADDTAVAELFCREAVQRDKQVVRQSSAAVQGVQAGRHVGQAAGGRRV